MIFTHVLLCHEEKCVHLVYNWRVDRRECDHLCCKLWLLRILHTINKYDNVTTKPKLRSKKLIYSLSLEEEEEKNSQHTHTHTHRVMFKTMVVVTQHEQASNGYSIRDQAEVFGCKSCMSDHKTSIRCMLPLFCPFKTNIFITNNILEIIQQLVFLTFNCFSFKNMNLENAVVLWFRIESDDKVNNHDETPHRI